MFDRLFGILASSAPVERVFSNYDSSAGMHFRKTSDSSTTLDCSLLPLNFYPYVDCFGMTMINVTVLKVIKKITLSLVRCVISFCINFVL